MSQTSEKFMIIDGNALLHRAWHAIPQTMKAPNGVVTNAAYGFMMIFLKAIREIKPSAIAVCFDSKGKTFRDKLYKEYKAHREKKPRELYDQIPIIQELLDAFNIPYFQKTGVEADDLIGTLVKESRVKNKETKNIIVTGDMDTLQLVDSATSVYTLKKGVTKTVVYGPKEVRERYGGLFPEQLVDFKALRGDPSDNIPGARGIGEKTAIDLMRAFGSIDALYKQLDQTGEADILQKFGIKEAVLEKVKESRDAVALSKKLAQIDNCVELRFSFDEAAFPRFKPDEVMSVFQKYAFRSLSFPLQKIEDSYHVSGAQTTVDEEISYVHIKTADEAKKFAREVSEETVIAVDTETGSPDSITTKLAGVGLSFNTKKAYYIPALFVSFIKPILENPKVKKIGHNIKSDIAALKNAGISMRGAYFDTMIAAYILNPGARQYRFDALIFDHFGIRMRNEICYTFRLYEKLSSEIKKKNLTDVFYSIEMPLVPILEEMERTGIQIDAAVLKELGEKVAMRIKKIEQEIYSLAGCVFNINSPQQLKDVLFSKLLIQTKGIRKVKTGVSTAATELEKLRGAHKIIEPIFEYRELTKLNSTYIKSLPLLVHPETGRIHTSFNQTIAATGRLSSSEPNMQNIPVKTDIGREIRRAFVAADGYRLLSLDYSQLELRIVAHLAGDEHLIQTFIDDKDVHTRTAARLFNKKESEVTADERRSAKEANFGVLYGLGPRGLKERLSLSFEEAQNFIDRYRALYPRVFLFLREVIESARKLGFVETLYGRRRYLGDINSSSPLLRSVSERAAINMPVQGTAADITKLAMIKIEAEIKKRKSSSDIKMLLQVHDELVFEARENVVTEWARIIKTEMENAVTLKVPLKVSAKAGRNWRETEYVK